jgi:hypothetical protein
MTPLQFKHVSQDVTLPLMPGSEAILDKQRFFHFFPMPAGKKTYANPKQRSPGVGPFLRSVYFVTQQGSFS